jgi:hypothetical protein
VKRGEIHLLDKFQSLEQNLQKQKATEMSIFDEKEWIDWHRVINYLANNRTKMTTDCGWEMISIKATKYWE